MLPAVTVYWPAIEFPFTVTPVMALRQVALSVKAISTACPTVLFEVSAVRDGDALPIV